MCTYIYIYIYIYIYRRCGRTTGTRYVMTSYAMYDSYGDLAAISPTIISETTCSFKQNTNTYCQRGEIQCLFHKRK